MQLLGPVFALVFLPLMLLVLLPLPKRIRPTALALISAVWYVLANRGNLMGMANLLALCLFAAAMVLPSRSLLPRFRLFFGSVLPLVLLISARLGAEFGPEDFRYPYGLTFVALASISAVVDRLRRDAPAPRHVGEICSYLLCFPLLTAGPLVTWKNYREALDEMNPSLASMAEGIRLYMGGATKCIAVSAVAFRSIQEILNAMEAGSHYLTVLILPLLGAMALYFFFAGACELGRGIAAMLGLSLPRMRRYPRHGLDATRMVFGLMPSLYGFLYYYVSTPLQKRIKGRAGRIIALLAVLLLWLPFFRMHPAVFLFLPPFFFLLLPAALEGGPRRRARPIRGPLLAIPAFCVVALFSLVVLSQSPGALWKMVTETELNSTYFFYYFYSVVAEIRYLLIGLAVAMTFTLLTLLRRLFAYRKNLRLSRIGRYAETALLFIAFLITLVYFAPQFPGYAVLPHPSLYF